MNQFPLLGRIKGVLVLFVLLSFLSHNREHYSLRNNECLKLNDCFVIRNMNINMYKIHIMHILNINFSIKLLTLTQSAKAPNDQRQHGIIKQFY